MKRPWPKKKDALAAITLLTLRLLKLVDEELDRVLWLIDDQAAHHVLKDLVEALLLDVLLATALEVNLLLFQHHLALL